MVSALISRDSYSYIPKKLGLFLKNRATPPTRPPIKDPPIFELKALISHLCYTFLRANNTLPVINIAYLLESLV